MNEGMSVQRNAHNLHSVCHEAQILSYQAGTVRREMSRLPRHVMSRLIGGFPRLFNGLSLPGWVTR